MAEHFIITETGTQVSGPYTSERDAEAACAALESIWEQSLIVINSDDII